MTQINDPIPEEAMSLCIRVAATVSLALTVISILIVRASWTHRTDPKGRSDFPALHNKSLTRNKRQIPEYKHFSLQEGKDVIGNNYKYAPDYWPSVPSPAPGPSLNDIILESNDGQYHGLSRRYKGEEANVMAFTERPRPEYVSESTISQYFLLGVTTPRFYENELLRLRQSQVNIHKLMTTVRAPPKVTTPMLANFFLPNYPNGILPVMKDMRRMMENVEDPYQVTQLPPRVAEFIRQKVKITGSQEIPPYKYNPGKFAVHTYPPLETIPPGLNSPVKLFHHMYGTTTSKLRTRRPKWQPTTTITTMKSTKDEEYLPEETDEEYDQSTARSFSPTQSKPLQVKKVKENYIYDATSTNVIHLLGRNKMQTTVKSRLLKAQTAESTISNTPELKELDLAKSGRRKPDIDSVLLDSKLLEYVKENKQNKTLAYHSTINPQNISNDDDINDDKKQPTRKKFGVMNDELKALLMGDDEEPSELAKLGDLLNDKDYVDPHTADIKELPKNILFPLVGKQI